MRLAAFSSRNTKEILRDPLNLGFGLGFPLILLILLSAIQANIPVSLFEIDRLAPGIAIFGLSFVALFSATLISKDRSSSLMTRLLASPLTSTDFILAYVIPLIPMAIVQVFICFLFSMVLGLKFNANVLLTIIVTLPMAVFFIGFGLMAGCLLTDKQVGGICGALLTNLSAWLSGTWFDLDLVGGVFKTIADLFPFSHAVNAARASIAGDYATIFPDLWWVIGYAIAMIIIAVLIFKKKMNNGNI